MCRMKATLSTWIVLLHWCMKDWRDYMLSIDSPFRFNVHAAPCTPISYIQSSDSEHKLIALHAPIVIFIVMSECKFCSSVNILKMLLACVLQINQLKLNEPIEIELKWNLSSMSRQSINYNRMAWFSGLCYSLRKNQSIFIVLCNFSLIVCHSFMIFDIEFPSSYHY